MKKVGDYIDRLKLQRNEARAMLAVAIKALDSIAAWHDGPEVTGRFDEPEAATVARKALKEIEGMTAAEEKGDAA